jgi:hypothetical protein
MADEERRRGGVGGEGVRYGITMGAALAITISWSVNKSVLWAILHGCLSWAYVLYHVLVH